MNKAYSVFAIIGVVQLVACTTPQPTKSANVASAFTNPAPKPRSNAIVPKTVTDALIPNFNQALATTKNTLQQAKLNISVNDVDAREFFMGLVVDTDENMLVHPEVSGRISLELKNVTIAQVLDAVQKVYGYDYKKNDMGYIIYPATLQTKTFVIDRLDLLRVGNSSTSVSSGKQAGQSGNQGGSQQNMGNQGMSSMGGSLAGSALGGSSIGGNAMGGSAMGITPMSIMQNANSSSSSLRTLTATDFWRELRESLNTMIKVDPAATININQQSGIVIVRAKPMQLREIESFLSATQTQISRQVILEAKILEVTLDDSHQDGVNWESIVSEGISKAPLLTGIGGLMDPQAFMSIFTVGGTAGGFRAFAELMATQGKTNVLSSPRVSTLNNQTAIIKVGQDEYFAYDIQTGTSGATAAGSTVVNTPYPKLDVFFSGIALDVTPQINDNDEIILHIHPSITEVTEEIKNFGTAIGSLPLALTTVRESDSIVKAKNGQIVVLGGLMQEKSDEKKQGVTGLAAIPYIGNLFRVNTGSMHKSELVILLKASYVGSDSDLKATKQRFESLDDQPRWK